MSLEQKICIGISVWVSFNVIYFFLAEEAEERLHLVFMCKALMASLMIPVVASLCLGVLMALVQVFFVAVTGERLILL